MKKTTASPPPRAGRKILVLLPNNLGDVIMATPVLEGLKRHFADCRISFLAEQGFEGGLVNNPWCDEIVLLPRKAIRDALRSDKWESGVAQLDAAAADLRNRAFDEVVNLSQHPFVSHLVPLIGAASVVGQQFLRAGNHQIADAWSQYLYAIPFARRCNALHAVDVYRRIAGVKLHSGCTVRLTAQEEAAAAQRLRQDGADASAGRIMVFQPGAAVPAKRWPVENFAALGTKLAEAGWTIVVSGAPAERELCLGVQERIGKACIVTAGRTTFREAVANVSLAQGLVTADTALMHAAAALDIRVYALFGATSPVETGPYGNGHWVFSSHCSQRPCFCTHCKNMLCMKAVSPDAVFGCIARESAPQSPGCDIYQTSLKPDGDYRLVAADGTSFSYFDPAGAWLTQRAFDGALERPEIDKGDFDACRAGSQEFLSALARMQTALTQYLEQGRAEAVAEFEEIRKGLLLVDGLPAFWTAILNIRLNSIPVIDARASVHKSLQVCARLALEVGEALAA